MAIFALVVLLAAGGCTTTKAYEGPERSDAELAFLVPDSPRVRNLDAPLEPSGITAVVSIRVAGQSPSATSSRLAVLPGPTTIEVSLRDPSTPVTARTLHTKPVTISANLQAGSSYRVRGAVIYPPASSRLTRTTDVTQYKVIFAVQDEATGEFLARGEVPHDRIELRPEY